MRILKSNLKVLYETGVVYPAPTNLNYNYNFGIYALVILMLQIVSGIFLVMYYAANTEIAFLA